MRRTPQFVAATLLIASSAAGASAQDLPTGQVIERVVCRDDETQSYALYVPARYATVESWPVIYCFDPAARGRLPVERLRAAAERFGYIIAGSNNSRNGGGASIDIAIRAMITDVERRFRVDRRQVYTAGFSGGARVAVQVAQAGLSKGVIACSAGFPGWPDNLPQKVPFPFFGTAGEEDMNLAEMIETERILESRGTLHRLTAFAGGHEWAPESIMTLAVEFLDLSAIRQKIRPDEPDAIDAAFKARVAAVPPGTSVEAWRALVAIATDYQGLADTVGIERRAKAIAETSAVADWKKAQQALVAREAALVRQLLDTTKPAQMKKAAGEVVRMEAADAAADRKMARRAISAYEYTAAIAVKPLLDARSYAEAIIVLETLVELRPENPRAYYDLARARALDGDRRRAVDALRQAVANGYSNAAVAEADPAFQRMRADTTFQSLVAQMKAPATAVQTVRP